MNFFQKKQACEKYLDICFGQSSQRLEACIPIFSINRMQMVMCLVLNVAAGN